MIELLTLLLNMYKLDIIDADELKLELFKAGYLAGPIEVNKVTDSDLKQLDVKNYNIKIKN